MTNKGRRTELTKLKHIKRCSILGLNPKEHYEYKAQGKPCSCIFCRPTKYKRVNKHKNNNI